VSLLIAVGSPSQAFGRSDAQFLLGLLGGALSVVAALVLALALSGALGSFGS
jgi:hypothetical protein